MRVISILNYKGGVGKTTVTACTAQALALTGFRVLAIDNDPQHNLSTMLGIDTTEPTIRDVYQSTVGMGAQVLRHAIRQTSIQGLSAVPSTNALSDTDIRDPEILKKIFLYNKIFFDFDFILIDNRPGLDTMQECSIHVSNEIFVPTELSRFAIDGIGELDTIIQGRLDTDCRISKIIPNFYRHTKRQIDYIETLQSLFPGRITETAIPNDTVFDTLAAEGKVLFLHRLSTKAAAFYLKLIHELFALDEDSTWEQVKNKRNERLSAEARQRYYDRYGKRGAPRPQRTLTSTHIPSI